MPRIAEESIRRVAEANDIVDVLGGYLQLKRAGAIYKTLCPFHKEKTPSFTVSPARQTYHCFGCQAGGGVIRFVMDYEHLSFVDAVRKLADRAGVRLVEDAGGDSGPSRNERARLLELHRVAAAWFHGQLLKSPAAAKARSYLTGRGMGGEIARSWQFGYAPPSGTQFAGWAAERGFSAAELVVCGLCVKRENGGRLADRFRDRVMIPIHNDSGEVIAFSGRILDPASSPAKYVNSPETPLFTKGRTLFGLHRSKRELINAGVALVCEGQFDLITAFENGVKNVIAPQGTAFTRAQAALLKRYVQQVILCFDADAAGIKAVERSLPPLLGEGLAVKVLLLPEGDDPDSIIRREGGAGFQQRTESARDIIDHQIDMADRSGELGTPNGMAITVRRIAQTLACMADPVARDFSLNLAAGRLGVPARQIAGSIGRIRTLEDHDETDGQENTDIQPLNLPEACQHLCKLAMVSPPVREWLAAQTDPGPGELGAGWDLLETIIQAQIEPDSPTSLAGFLAGLPPAAQATIAEWNLAHLPKDMPESARETWRGVLRQRIEAQIGGTKARLHDRSLPPQETAKINKELLDLRRKLQDLVRPNLADSCSQPIENKA